MNDEQIKKMVDRFLAWRFPSDFAPDGGISYKPPMYQTWQPVGTNLLTATQAEEMIRYITQDIFARGNIRPKDEFVIPMLEAVDKFISQEVLKGQIQEVKDMYSWAGVNMKTTLVKERIVKIFDDLDNDIAGFGYISKDVYETATQAIQKLVDDECIKARIKELRLITKRLEANSWGHFDPISVPTDRIKELRATESPRKKGGVKDD